MPSKLPFLHFPPVVPSPEIQRSHFISRQNCATTISQTATSNFTRQTLLLTSNRRQNQSFLSLPMTSKRPTSSLRSVSVRSNLNLSFPLISPTDQGGTWAVLFATGALGIWSEGTKIGRALGGASVSTLLGLAASSLGIISCESPAYSILLEFLFPLTIPLLLFRADFRRVFKSTGTIFLAFLIGSVGTIVGTALAYMMVPMRALSDEMRSIAAALAAGHMGGAMNYLFTVDFLHVSPSVLATGLAARNVICAVYFTSLFALASKLPPDHESSTSTDDATMDGGSDVSGNKLSVLQTATALVVSFAICKAGSYITEFRYMPAFILPTMIVTAVIQIILATAFPTQFNHLAPSGEALAMILMQVFSAMVGARGNIWNVINTEPSILMFVLVQIAGHLAVILGLGKLFRFDQKLLLIASNANIGGHTTVYGMATAKGWSSLVVPAILAGIFANALIIFIGFVAVYVWFLAAIVHLLSNPPSIWRIFLFFLILRFAQFFS